MTSMTALEWLTEVAGHPSLSMEAKEVAAIMSEGWTGCEGRCSKGVQGVLERSRLTSHLAVRQAAGELRRAGFVTGKGLTKYPWKLHDPAKRLPDILQDQLTHGHRHETRSLDHKIRLLLNGGTV